MSKQVRAVERKTSAESDSLPFVPFEIEDIEQSIPSRFEAQAALYPQRMAIKTDDAAVTYEALNWTANRIARAIVSRIAPGQGQAQIAYLLSSDVKSAAVILGILKSGNVYVPLDPEHPRARSCQVLEDAQASLIITDGQNCAAAQELSGAAAPLNVDAISADIPGENLGAAIPPDAHAYIVYTSGSTGKPKGLVQNHRNLLLTAKTVTNSLAISPTDRITLFSARTSAQAMTITFSALLNGATIYPFRTKEVGLDRLSSWLLREQITIYHSISSIFNYFVRTLDGNERFPNLRVVKLGGEPVSRREFELYKKHFAPECVFVNALSSTEAGTFRQFLADKHVELSGSVVPVGYAVPELEVVLLDETGQPVAAGEVGEIFVRSRYLAPGYWRNPELTERVFLPDHAGSDMRMYRTGDLGRLSADGCLDHLGRKDFQVKIRGNRVELAEIEMALLEVDTVAQAVVIAPADKQGEAHLVAYVVPSVQPPPTVASLRMALRKTLPNQLLPSAFVFLEALPLTPMGKVDRKALPEVQVRKTQVLPRNSVEGHIARIWEDILSVRPIGVQDDFFEIGGNSLLAARVVNYIESDFGKRLPIATFFTASTVEELAKLIPETKRDDSSSALTKIQEGTADQPFFFVHGQYNGGGFYCLKLAVHLGDHRTFYALQPLGPQGDALPPSIETMAASYVKLVRSAQPFGPYLLGGYCNGGLIAFEMAQQLRAAGETVDIVAIIESVARNTQFRAQRKWASRVAKFACMGPEKEIDWFIRLRSFANRYREVQGLERLRLTIGKLQRLPEAAMLLGRAIARKRESKYGAPESSSQAMADDPGWLDRTPHYSRIVTSYVPQPYPGRIVVFRAAERETPTDHPSLGWHEVTSDLDVRLAPGGHSTCVTEPDNLAILAEDLRMCLEERSTGRGQ